MLKAYGGFKIKPEGVTNLKCRVKGNSEVIKFIVANVNSMPLLGYETSSKLGFVNINLVESQNIKIQSKEELISKYREVFRGLGKFKQKCTLKIKANVEPIARPPRRIPLSMKDRLIKKLKELESMGIICKEDKPTGWVSNLVITEKPNGALRLCIDPQDLNKVLCREYYQIPTLDEICSKLEGKSVFSSRSERWLLSNRIR